VADERRAWHAGPSRFEGREKVNDFSIGIELVNAQTGTDPFTDAQYASLIALTADLVSRYNIPLTHITGHRHVTNYPELKHDPADNFDWERYLVGVQEMLANRQVVRSVTPLAPVGAAVGGAGR
jgi:AmpD protein